MNLQIQFITVAAMIGCGAAMGVVFDTYRVLCGPSRHRRWLIPVLDLLYWLLAALVIFRILYISNNGEVRFYVFLGLILGTWLYFLWMSTITVKFVVWLIQAIRRFISLAVRAFDLLVVKPLLAMYRLFRIVAGFLLAALLFLARMVLYVLHPLWKLLVWPVRPIIARLTLPKRLRQWIAKARQIWNRWI